MSGTVLGKSCLVLGVVWDVECQGSARSQGRAGGREGCPRNGHTELSSQVGLKQGEHGHTKSPAGSWSSSQDTQGLS